MFYELNDDFKKFAWKKVGEQQANEQKCAFELIAEYIDFVEAENNRLTLKELEQIEEDYFNFPKIMKLAKAYRGCVEYIKFQNTVMQSMDQM